MSTLNFDEDLPVFETALKRVQKWVEDHGYKGYEPFDGLSSVLKPLTFGNLFLQRVLQQVVRQSPVNLRPILGVSPKESTKGRGYMAWGYLDMYGLTEEEKYRELTEETLDWLIEHKSPLYEDFSWGNSFNYASRSGKIPMDLSTIVWTGLIGEVFLQAYEKLGDQRFLDVAASTCRWIMALPRETTSSGLCLSYVMPEQSSIHNSNMIGAAMLARTFSHTGDEKLRDLAMEAMAYSCSRQLPDGAWYYGEDPMNHWIDNFHTGYNLDALKRYSESLGDSTWDDALAKGFTYFKGHFFEPDGLPRYYHNRAYPIDIQCASQAITTLVFFSDMDPGSVALAEKVALWTIRNMTRPDGAFMYRVYPWGKAVAPMIHWGQATMFKALASLLRRLGRDSGGKEQDPVDENRS